MKLLRHATDLVKDIAKFENSIAMVATKVDNQYFRHANSFTLVDDDKVIKSIADFLLEAKEYLEEQERLPNVSTQKKHFYQKCYKIRRCASDKKIITSIRRLVF
ncbi:uncharacterized protein CEXT_80051 [Caerostris extrusa]|uniref:Uncharacterized protein n=1 Tax=Caerostris extrusa TaxID=172846 RepID=A0AAV4T014_CAEEX|nr:uncharacterized protein CEXT_80051 [Caerostris extrusa]